MCARVRCNHITYDGRRVADGTEENREKKNDEWTEGEETGETRWDREVEKLHWLVGGTVERCSCPGGIWTPARLSLSFSPTPLLSLSLPLPLLSLSLSLSFSLSLLLTLPPSFPYSLPSLRFYPTAKRRRVTWTQKRSIRASPTRPSLSPTRRFSILLSHPFRSIILLLGSQPSANLWYRAVHLRVFAGKALNLRRIRYCRTMPMLNVFFLLSLIFFPILLDIRLFFSSRWKRSHDMEMK